MLEGQRRQAACNKCKTLWAASSIDKTWSLVLSTFLGYSGSCNQDQLQTYNGRVKWAVANVRSLSWTLKTNPLQWWQILNIRSCIMSPTGCLWPCLLSSGVFNHCFNPSRSLSVPAAWCIFTSAIDYQTIFDDYSSSPWSSSSFQSSCSLSLSG